MRWCWPAPTRSSPPSIRRMRQAPDELWNAVENACRTHAAFILDRLKSAPQTNEVRRSAALLPGFLTISSLFHKPLVLSEVGASAGLNLHWDHYDYRLGRHGLGLAPVAGAALRRSGPVRTPPNVPVQVASRAGCDLNPLDPARKRRRPAPPLLCLGRPDRPAGTHALCPFDRRRKPPDRRSARMRWIGWRNGSSPFTRIRFM